MKGESHYKAKLTEEDVKHIRSRYAEGGISYRQLAVQYDVDKSNIASIIKYKSWKD